MKKKIIIGTFSVAAISMPVALAVSCGNEDVKPVFYNYEAYMAEAVQEQVSEVFSYKTFGDLPEFESFIDQHKTVGGIGSDYLNAKLAKEGKIQKLDFRKIFPSLKDKSDDEIAVALQQIYTPEAWNLMASFDGYLGNKGHLYEYMIPYFIQNKVVAFDLTQDMVKTEQTGHWWTQQQFSDLTSGEEAKINSVFDIDATNNTEGRVVVSYDEIFTQLSNHGYTTPIINDYWRDNLMIGSEASNFSNTFPNASTAKTQAEGFNSLVRKIQKDGSIELDTDGVSTLGKLIGHNDAEYDVATLYNGDAYDAYTNGEEFTDASEKTIGVIKPFNSTYLLDGLVIPSYVAGADLDSMYHVAKDILFDGADKATSDVMDGSQLLSNFEFVGYTTPYKSLIDGLDEEYFGDKLAQYISVGMISGATIDTNHITQPLASSTIQEDGLREYRKVFTNTTN